jgi:hypothetical protein
LTAFSKRLEVRRAALGRDVNDAISELGLHVVGKDIREQVRKAKEATEPLILEAKETVPIGKTDIAGNIDVAGLYTDIKDDASPIEHIGGIFPRGDVTVFFGKSGCGKTIWLDCITRQLSEGGTIMDGFRKGEPARKIIFFEADANKKLFETRKYAFRFGGNAENLKHVFTRELVQKGIWLDIATDEGYALVYKIADIEHPDVMIFDTLQGFHTLDENRADEMKPLFMKFVQLATKFNCAIVVIHHARKNGTKFKPGRLSAEDAQGSNIFLREAGAVIVLEKLTLAEKTIHVFSLKKSWANPTKDDWFGFEFKETGLYDTYTRLAFELFPDTGETKTNVLKRVIAERDGWFSVGDIEKDAPNASRALIKKVLSEMAEASLLEKSGVGKATRYQAIPFGVSPDTLEKYSHKSIKVDYD